MLQKGIRIAKCFDFQAGRANRAVALGRKIVIEQANGRGGYLLISWHDRHRPFGSGAIWSYS